ncbi:response regulator [Peijinzhouia sedimentorum]|tara:strand:- start:331 stop:726 length:396 start_codon:yes stop_codon:yes gene_type:complete
MKRVWIIDDDDLYVFICKKMLNKLGLENDMIESFPNGKAGLDSIKNRDDKDKLPSLILLDINMPIMNGWDFLDEINPYLKKLPNDLTIAILSSSVEPSDKAKALSYNEVQDYISKPVNIEDLKRFLFVNQA